MIGKPLIVIYTGAVEMTGAIVAAYREAVLMKDHADFALVVSDQSPLTAEQFPGVQLLRLPLARVARTAASMLGYPVQVLRSARALARTLSGLGCTRLQVNDFYLLEGALTRLFGFKGIIVTWVRIDPCRYGGPLARLWLAAAWRASRSIVAVSRFISGQLGSELRPKLLYDPCPDIRLAVPPNSERLVFLGNYSEGKGQDLAIRAFASIAPNYPAARLEFYGGDLSLERNRQYRQSLTKLVAEFGLERQVFINGFVDDPGDVLDGALVSLNLSTSESFSLTCQEASARGLAVIATMCGDPQEIVADGRTGWLVPVGDQEAVARNMRDALNNPEHTHRMGLAGAALMRERFSPRAFQEGLSELFDVRTTGLNDGGAA